MSASASAIRRFVVASEHPQASATSCNEWPSTCLNIHGMRARVAQVGGEMSVSDAAGGGTTLTVEVPT